MLITNKFYTVAVINLAMYNIAYAISRYKEV